MLLGALGLATGVVVALARGGSLRNLRTWRLRAWALVLPGVGLPLLAERVPQPFVGRGLVLAGYAALGLVVARNIMLVGIGVIACGLAANLAVIVLNAAMPVSANAVVSAGIAGAGGVRGVDYGRRHRLEAGGEHLRLLDDRIPVPGLHQVLSIGDLVIDVGAADVAANLVLRPRRRRLSSPRPALRPA